MVMARNITTRPRPSSTQPAWYSRKAESVSIVGELEHELEEIRELRGAQRFGRRRGDARRISIEASEGREGRRKARQKREGRPIRKQREGVCPRYELFDAVTIDAPNDLLGVGLAERGSARSAKHESSRRQEPPLADGT